MKEEEKKKYEEYQKALDALAAVRKKLTQGKEFPMPESYKKQTDQLLKLLEIREKINKQLEFMTPEKRRQTIKESAELDEKIEDFEKQIAAYYEIHQLMRAFETEKEKVDARLIGHTHKIYICLKHRAPKEKFDEFVEIINTTLSPEERENFYDQAAILEATRLNEILGEKTE